MPIKPKETHKLPDEARIYIVRALACRERPASILAQVLEQFDVTMHRSNLANYDPRFNTKLDPELKSLYERTAREFWSDKEFASFNSLQHRQRLREELYEDSGNNRPLKLQILTESAKDEGGLYSNRRELTGAEGAPLVNVQNISTASAEDILKILACFPLELLPLDMAELMVDRGLVPPERAKELPALRGEVVEGEVVPQKTTPKRARRPRVKSAVEKGAPVKDRAPAAPKPKSRASKPSST